MRHFLLIFLLWGLGGCYEGWDYAKNGKGDGDDPSLDPPVVVVKPYAYILFEVFTLSPEAMQDPTCFPKTGIREFRQTEWNLRRDSLRKVLYGLADTMVETIREVSVSDCQILNTVESSAVDPTPWPEGNDPEQDPDDRLFLHFKTVIWEEDPAVEPSSLVLANDWSAWKILQTSGLNAVSVGYFLYTDPNNGFFTMWEDEQETLYPKYTSSAFVIDPVDPSAEGEQLRNQIIAADATYVEDWLKEVAELNDRNDAFDAD